MSLDKIKSSIYDFTIMDKLPHMCTRSKIKIPDNKKHSIDKYFDLDSLRGYLNNDYILDWLTMRSDCTIRDKPNKFIEFVNQKKIIMSINVLITLSIILMEN